MSTPIDPSIKLPCDVEIGHVIFRKGVELETLRLAAERYFMIARKAVSAEKLKEATLS